VPLTPQTPPLPVSLLAPCPALHRPPIPLADPERALWETDLIAAYGDCAARHHATAVGLRRAGEAVSGN
jgi:hypothetical protein